MSKEKSPIFIVSTWLIVDWLEMGLRLHINQTVKKRLKLTKINRLLIDGQEQWGKIPNFFCDGWLLVLFHFTSETISNWTISLILIHLVNKLHHGKQRRRSSEPLMVSHIADDRFYRLTTVVYRRTRVSVRTKIVMAIDAITSIEQLSPSICDRFCRSLAILLDLIPYAGK